MAKKRFTDTEIWDKEWFMNLAPKLKCLIRYLFDRCDASGVWTPNWKLASLHIGEPVNLSDMHDMPDDQWELMRDGKIFLPGFIDFQYGQLSEASPAHKPIFLAITKNNLTDRVFNRVSHTLQEKEKEKEKETDKEKEKEKDNKGKVRKVSHAAKPHLFNESDFCDKEKFEAAFAGTQYEAANLEYYHEVINNWSNSKAHKKVDWIATAKNWMASDMKEGKFITKDFQPVQNGHSKTSRQPAGAKINGPKLDTLFNERYGKGGR